MKDRRQLHSFNYTELVIRSMARLSKQGDEEGYERARQAMVRHHQVMCDGCVSFRSRGKYWLKLPRTVNPESARPGGGSIPPCSTSYASVAELVDVLLRNWRLNPVSGAEIGVEAQDTENQMALSVAGSNPAARPILIESKRVMRGRWIRASTTGPSVYRDHNAKW